MDADSRTATFHRKPRGGRTRGAVPALVAGVLTAGGLWVLQLLADTDPLRSLQEDAAAGQSGLWVGLIGDKVRFFGRDTHALFESGDEIVRVALVTIAIVLVAFVITWLGTVGTRARSVFPVLIAGWLGAILACAAGLIVSAADTVVVSGGDLLGVLGPRIDLGGAYGLTYGWIPALLATLAWAATPARRTYADGSPEDEDGETVPWSTLIGEDRDDTTP